ncbi:MAG: hypothetical protein MJZ20_09510 [Bacteroidaceae bacterium]|nr:hypothetical protein [Bacteroidaceae bacterium]
MTFRDYYHTEVWDTLMRRYPDRTLAYGIAKKALAVEILKYGDIEMNDIDEDRKMEIFKIIDNNYTAVEDIAAKMLVEDLVKTVHPLKQEYVPPRTLGILWREEEMDEDDYQGFIVERACKCYCCDGFVNSNKFFGYIKDDHGMGKIKKKGAYYCLSCAAAYAKKIGKCDICGLEITNKEIYYDITKKEHKGWDESKACYECAHVFQYTEGYEYLQQDLEERKVLPNFVIKRRTR